MLLWTWEWVYSCWVEWGKRGRGGGHLQYCQKKKKEEIIKKNLLDQSATVRNLKLNYIPFLKNIVSLPLIKVSSSLKRVKFKAHFC